VFARTGDEVEVHLGALDAPDQLLPTYESWIIRRESWLPAFPLARHYPRDRAGKGRTEDWPPGDAPADGRPSLFSRFSRGGLAMTSKNTICLWYDGTALEAAQFYARTFPDSSIGRVIHAPADYPAGKEGDVILVEFNVAGIPCIGLNGGPAFSHNEAFSFQIATEDQEETDRLWNAIISNGGQESECGWCKDKWGISWQITPRVLSEALANPDRAAARRAFEAMLTMRKIDVAKIEAALKG